MSTGSAIVGLSAVLTSLLLRSGAPARWWAGLSGPVCTTIATDPNPPLNVRSSPVTAPDNVIGKLKNGTQLSVVDENAGWLRISHPVAGWVFKSLTVTSCAARSAQPHQDRPQAAAEVLAAATEQYHAGNLNGAIALAQTVPATSPLYAMTQATIAQWRQDWQRAESQFYSAQSALSQGNRQAVLQTVKTFPANRFWRDRLTPLVQQAIRQPER